MICSTQPTPRATHTETKTKSKSGSDYIIWINLPLVCSSSSTWALRGCRGRENPKQLQPDSCAATKIEFHVIVRSMSLKQDVFSVQALLRHLRDVSRAADWIVTGFSAVKDVFTQNEGEVSFLFQVYTLVSESDPLSLTERGFYIMFSWKASNTVCMCRETNHRQNEANHLDTAQCDHTIYYTHTHTHRPVLLQGGVPSVFVKVKDEQ